MQVVPLMTTATIPPVASSLELGKRAIREASSLRARFVPDGRGGGTLSLGYTGPLTCYENIFVRLGERRHGQDWVQTRDFPMERSDVEAALVLEVAGGEPVEAFTFAFFTKVCAAGQEVWDNAGKPFGCYVLDAKTGRIASR